MKMKPWNILVACEESQEVTKRLRDRGHIAWSCDLLPTSGKNPEWHIQGDVTLALQFEWDMVLAFPPCTHLASSGARWFPQKQKDGRQNEGIDFFMKCIEANAPRVCVENPVGIMSTKYRRPDQYVHPWQFGDSFEKTTCLWLKGLPFLKPTRIVSRGEFVSFYSKKSDKIKRQPKWYYDALKLSPDERARMRSKTFPGIAAAMAEQWTKNIIQ